jgi:hypothetical protein
VKRWGSADLPLHGGQSEFLSRLSDPFWFQALGSRGKQSRLTPAEPREVAGRRDLDGEALVRTSRFTAKSCNRA